VRAAKLGNEIADRLIADGRSISQARDMVFDVLAARSEAIRTEQHIVVGEDSRDKFVRGGTAWLIEKSGTRHVVERAKKAGVQGFENIDLDPGEFRGMSLRELARESLERQHVRTRGMSAMDLVGRALTMQRDSGYATSSDFAVLFENTLNKVLLGAYQ